MLRGLVVYFARHRTIANLLMVVMVVLGLLASTVIRTQFFPDSASDGVTVTVPWTGAGAEDVDGAIVAVMEPSLLAVEGVTEVYSVSSEGRARIALEFESGWDMDRAADEVKATVDGITNLPENADDPTIRRDAWRDRVTDVLISGPVSLDQLGRFADELSTRLFREGIARTSVRGISAPRVRVTATEGDLIRAGVSLREISNAISAEAEADPAGDVAGGTQRLRSGVEKRAAEDVARVAIRSEEDGTKLTVADVARITVEGADRGRAYFYGDNPAVIVRVDRSEEGDAIRMQETVEKVAAELAEVLPEGTTIQLTNSRAESIEARLNMLFENAAIGLILVLVLLFLFLNPITAFWVAMGIPIAMLGTVALMYISGQTINMISLFALIICLGIVVDDAIVVGEHADFRVRRLGEKPTTAAENAALRMGMPVLSSSITTIIAFFGLTIIGGRFGSLIYAIPFAVVVVLIASLIECFLILPHHMARSLRPAGKTAWYEVPNKVFNAGFSWFRRTIFDRFIRLVLTFRYAVIALALFLLTQVAAMFMTGDVTWRFFNAPEWGRVTGNVAMLPGATRDDTLEQIRELQRATSAVGERLEGQIGTNPIRTAVAQVGGSGGRGLAGADAKDADLLGSITIELIDADLRPGFSSFAILGTIEEEVRRHAMLETLSFRGGRFGPGGDSLDVSFFGASTEVLKAAAEALKTAVSAYPEVSAVEDDMPYDKNELILELTPQGQALGYTADALGTELYQRLNGIDAAEYPVGTRTGKITVKMDDAELGADFLDTARIRSPSGAYIPLSDLVTVTERTGFSRVIRDNGLPRIKVTGDISEDDAERAVEITEELQSTILPAIAADYGVSWEIGGLAEQENEFLSDARNALYLCLLGIFMALAWVFQSWTRPIVVMAIIPFGLIGTVWGHYWWDVPLSMFTVVGILGMIGIIINDSIVLVTTIDEYARTNALRQAVITAVSDRLRPVILTTLTTVFGIAPLLFEGSQQAQFLKPTVITLAYGLGFGLFLVLLVVPALVIIQEDVGKLVRSWRRGLHAPLGFARVMVPATLAALGLVIATVGYREITGTLLSPVASIGALTGLSDKPAAFASLAIGLGLIFALGLLATRRLGRKAS